MDDIAITNNAQSTEASDDELDIRVTRVRHSLVKLFSRVKSRSIGLRKLVERPLLLVQEPICLAFFQEENEIQREGLYLNKMYLGHTISDPAFAKRMAIEICHELVVKDKIRGKTKRCLRPEKQDSVFQIFGTKYYAAAFLIQKNETDGVEIQLCNSNKHSIVYDLLKSCVARFSNKSKGNNHSDGIRNGLDLSVSGFEHLDDQMTGAIDKIRIDHSFNIKDSDPDLPILQDSLGIVTIREQNLDKRKTRKFYKIEDIMIKESKASVLKILDTQYREVYESPAVSKKYRNPPNITFYFKFFDRLQSRYKSQYHFNSQLMIPELQREHWVELFDKIKKANQSNDLNFSAGKWMLPYISLSKKISAPHSELRGEKKIPFFGDSLLDALFWKTLRSKNGPEKIVDILGRGTSHSERVFVDGALANGTLHAGPRISTRHAIRFDSNNKRGSRKSSYLRNACAFYLTNALAPFYANEPSLFLVPAQVSESTWLCYGKYTKNSLVEPGRQPADIFNGVYHFHDAVCAKVSRKIRAQSEIEYLNLIRLVFKITIDMFQQTPRTELENCNPIEQRNLNLFVEYCNLGLSAIGRVFPYPVAQIEIRKSIVVSDHNSEKLSRINRELEYQSEHIPMDDSGYLSVFLIENPWYNSFKTKWHIDIRQVSGSVYRGLFDVSERSM